LKFGVELMRTRMNLTGNDVARGRFTFNGQYTTATGSAPTVQNSMADYLLGLMSSSGGSWERSSRSCGAGTRDCTCRMSGRLLRS
jgi:hypothetical protein